MDADEETHDESYARKQAIINDLRRRIRKKAETFLHGCHTEEMGNDDADR
jgi:hypothetical protein